MTFTEGITGTLQDIKDYFKDWHTNNYEILHKKTDQLTDQEPIGLQPIQSNTVYKKFQSLTANDIKDATRGAPNNQSVQTTLDSFDSRINNVNNKLRVASYGTLPDVVGNAQRYYDPDGRGFNFPALSGDYDGFITAKEKADIYYYGKWYELTGTQAGFDKKHRDHITMWVNIGLRLVYFHFGYTNCPWLKNSTEYMAVPFTDKESVGWNTVPIHHIWAPTNANNIRMGMTKDGEFYLRSNTTISGTRSINGSMMWFYRDGPVSSKIGLYKG